ncbi:MAG: hypothetical protein ABIW84_04885 [Ilumatobacteraceae bacterium]
MSTTSSRLGAASGRVRTTAEAFERAGSVADAVLYEGYVLYPYRASSAKNQVRWQFGVLVPRRFAEDDGAEQWQQQTEVIVEFAPTATVDIRVRFLQVQARTVEAAMADGFTPVAHLEVDGQRWATWEEAVEHAVDVNGVDVATLGVRETPFTVAAFREVEALGEAGRVVRERWAVEGVLRIAVTDVPGPYPLHHIQLRVENVTEWGAGGHRREEAMRHSFVGVNVLVHADDARFLSSLEPPEFARGAVASCTNLNAFPVLIGDEGDDTTILSSPIILYDRPEVADESPGDMCDATEIDEILALRVLTLTDAEKIEARATDPRAAAIIDRIDDFSPETFERLHGAMRSLRAKPEAQLPWWEPAVDASVDPWSDTIVISGVVIGKGAKVVLRPGHRRSDAQDLFLAGRSATVEGVFFDVDGDQHVAVTVDDDHGDGLQQAHGRFLYFHPDEVEPVR